MTPSERYVFELCKQSFLPFWSFHNPIGKKNKELCDLLVVCADHIIIISVKDVSISNHRDESVQYDRWVKRAIADSVDQIYGAERFLNGVDEVLLSDRTTKIKLPPISSRQFYRIAIAFGSIKEYPLPMGDFGKGFVSVFDEQSTSIVFNELDTITDFTQYLSAKQKFIDRKIVLVPSEADFLAVYLNTGLEFEQEGVNTFVCDPGVWENYITSDDYSKWKNDAKDSYIWDEMISRIYNNHLTPETSQDWLHQLQESLLRINLESRVNRIELGSVLKNAIKRKVKGRMVQLLPGSEHSYVFMPLSSKNWKAKESELKLRCIVARVLNPSVKIVIGISIGRNKDSQLHFDLCFLDIPELNNDIIDHARVIQNELGYFRNSVYSHSKEFRE